MRQAIVTIDYKPNTGGVAEYWRHLFANLPKDQFVLIAPLADIELELGVVRMDFLYKNIWPKWLKLFFNLKKYFVENNVYNMIAGQVLPVGTVAYLLKKLRYLQFYTVSCHSMDIAHVRGWKKFLIKIILQAADNIIVNSKYTKTLVQDYGIRKNINIIYPAPQSLPIVNYDLSQQYNWLDKPLLLSVGRLVRRKGFDQVIFALPKIWHKYPDLHYVVIGEGEDRSYLENLIKDLPAAKAEQVHLLGQTKNEDLVAWYKAADIFVLPSRNLNGDVEGFGIVNLEAAGYKLPVIVGKDGGVPETVLDNISGYVVDGSTPDLTLILADKIFKLLSDPTQRQRMGETGYDFAHNFSWKKSADVLLKSLNI